MIEGVVVMEVLLGKVGEMGSWVWRVREGGNFGGNRRGISRRGSSGWRMEGGNIWGGPIGGRSYIGRSQWIL